MEIGVDDKGRTVVTLTVGHTYVIQLPDGAQMEVLIPEGRERTGEDPVKFGYEPRYRAKTVIVSS